MRNYSSDCLFGLRQANSLRMMSSSDKLSEHSFGTEVESRLSEVRIILTKEFSTELFSSQLKPCLLFLFIINF